MAEHSYFTVMPTGLSDLPHDDLIAIFAGDAPVHGNGKTSLSLRLPMLILTDAFEQPQEIAETIAAVLNENAHRFFPSANHQTEGQP